MLRITKFALLLLFAMAIMPAYAAAQGKGIKPLPDSASLAETRKWLADSIRKYGSYKTRTMSVSITDVGFDGCSLGVSLTRKSNSIAQDQMGVRTRVHTSKQDFAFDFSFVIPDGITLADHIYPELQTVTVRFRSGKDVHVTSNENRDVELIVRNEAGEAIRSALVHARKLCTAKN